jgi:hypothetical protein
LHRAVLGPGGRGQEGGHQDGDQYANDCHHHHELQQREAVFPMLGSASITMLTLRMFHVPFVPSDVTSAISAARTIGDRPLPLESAGDASRMK